MAEKHCLNSFHYLELFSDRETFGYPNSLIAERLRNPANLPKQVTPEIAATMFAAVIDLKNRFRPTNHVIYEGSSKGLNKSCCYYN